MYCYSFMMDECTCVQDQILHLGRAGLDVLLMVCTFRHNNIILYLVQANTYSVAYTKYEITTSIPVYAMSYYNYH